MAKDPMARDLAGEDTVDDVVDDSGRVDTSLNECGMSNARQASSTGGTTTTAVGGPFACFNMRSRTFNMVQKDKQEAG
jgi:hypothetical protein